MNENLKNLRMKDEMKKNQNSRKIIMIKIIESLHTRSYKKLKKIRIKELLNILNKKFTKTLNFFLRYRFLENEGTKLTLRSPGVLS